MQPCLVFLFSLLSVIKKKKILLVEKMNIDKEQNKQTALISTREITSFIQF